MAASTYIANGWASGVVNNDGMRAKGGYEGWKFGANWAVAKNIVAQVEYHDLDAKDDSAWDNKTLWSQVVFTF